MRRAMASPQKVLCLILLALAAATAGRAIESNADQPLTTAAALLSLPADRAGMRLPVIVTGVVTAAESDWTGQFFLQDETAGVFVENIGRAAPAPGDVVTVEGVSHPGAFAPIISEPRWRKTGTAPLPEAKHVQIDDLQCGMEDGLRVEVTGIVRTARIEREDLNVDLSVLGHRLQVRARIPGGLAVDSLVGARVQVRGTTASHYLSSLRHLTSVAVYAPRMEDFTVIEPESFDPFTQQVIPVNRVAQYRRGRHAEQRVRIGGVVTLSRPGGELFLQDDTGGIRIICAAPANLAIGDAVEVAGFVEYEGHLPLLRDAVVRSSAARVARVPPSKVSMDRLLRGDHYGEFISLSGKLLDRTTRPGDGPVGEITTWLVQGEGLTFTVEHFDPAPNSGFAAIPMGSTVEVDGICTGTADISGRLSRIQLIMPAADNLRVLRQPSWFTPVRLLIGLGIVSAVLLVVVTWSLTVTKKNVALHRLVRELEQAQRQLQEAHDTLEEKVAERSAQLQVEMTARKTSELQFKAVLAERTRLARDLHDTLNQTLAGIGLRLKLSEKLARNDPDSAEAQLQLARTWLHQSQVDLRRSIWDLRSRELEQFDLAGALRNSAELLTSDSSIELEFRTEGQVEGLPEIVEENVLRIGQEALTNIAKHAAAKHVAVHLSVDSDFLRLRIADDGRGFDQASIPADGHFGMTGMEERAKRVSGRLTMKSSPGGGTTMVLEIPLLRELPASQPEQRALNTPLA